MNEFEQLNETFKSGKEVYHGPLLHVYHDRVTLPNGNETGRDYIRHLGAACVIPVDENLDVYVERQFRYPVHEVLTEIPAGKLDSAEEDPLEAAKRELREETGLAADEWIFLGNFYSACAYTNEKIGMYMARKLRQGERELDPDEFLNVTKIPLSELVRQVMAGEISDSKTQTAILKAARLLGV